MSAAPFFGSGEHRPAEVAQGTLYSGMLAWLLTKLRKARRLGWWAGTAFAVAATAEVAGITVQAARGTFSHFNTNMSDPVNVAMTQLASGATNSSSTGSTPIRTSCSARSV